MNVLSSHEGISLLPVPDDSGQVLSDHCRTLGVSDDDPHEINLENQRYGSRSRVASLPCHVIVPLYKRLFSLTSCPNQAHVGVQCSFRRFTPCQTQLAAIRVHSQTFCTDQYCALLTITNRIARHPTLAL